MASHRFDIYDANGLLLGSTERGTFSFDGLEGASGTVGGVLPPETAYIEFLRIDTVPEQRIGRFEFGD